MRTLARLSLHLPPERLADVARDFEQALLPVLARHAMGQPEPVDRPQASGALSWLVAVDSPSALPRLRTLLRRDSGWQELLRDLGRSLPGASSPSTAATGAPGPHHHSILSTDLRSEASRFAMDCRLAVYRAPAGPGRELAAGAGARRGQWLSLGVGDGLPSAAVPCLLPASDGRVWIAVVGAGVCWYDGSCFGLLTPDDGLPFTDLGAIAEDDQGNLWFGTCAGLCRFDGQSMETFTEADGLASDGIAGLVAQPGGVLWVATTRGLSRYDGHGWQCYRRTEGLTDGEVHRMLLDDAGVLWAGTNEGLGRVQDGRVTRLTRRDGLPGDLVEAVAQRQAGELWLAVYGAGACRLADGQVTAYAAAEGGPAETASCLAIGPGRHVWVGTHGSGLARFDGSRWRTFTAADGLASSMVTSVAFDRDGRLWCATWGGGISAYEGNNLEIWTRADGLPSDGAMAVARDRQGAVWVGTWAGVSRFLAGSFTHVDLQDELRPGSVWRILEDRQGRIWLEVHGREGRAGAGLACWDGSGLRTYGTADGLPEAQVQGLAEDRHGTLWCGTGGAGLYRFDGSRFAPAPLPGLSASEGISALHADQAGRLWVGTYNGLVVIGPDGRLALLAGTREQVGSDAPWVVDDFCEARDGTIWLATHSGAVHYDGLAFRLFTTAEGLPSNHLTCVAETRSGHICVGTWGAGLSVYDGRVWNWAARPDGLVHESVQDIVEDPDGRMWVASEGGLMRYRRYETPPAVALTAVVADRRMEPSGLLEVPVSTGLLAFEYRGRSLTTRPGRMVYLYRLRGAHEDWRQTRQTRVEYAELAVGRYVFEVQAVDRDMNYSRTPACVQVEVVPDPVIQGLSALFVPKRADDHDFVGTSPELRLVQSQLAQVATAPVTVLIVGETGTGKGLAARYLHAVGPRRDSPLITVSCGAMPALLVESELFGHEKGSFTGAVNRQLGKAELAGDGTLFLDEIGDLPLEAQPKLLRLLEEGTFERVGGRELLRLRARVVAATNRDLHAMVARGEMREDLFFRLQVYVVRVPPLRERREDIPLLAAYFAQRMAAHLHKAAVRLEPDALRILEGYDWPGNVRELQHAVERAVVISPGDSVGARELLLDGRLGRARGGAGQPGAPSPGGQPDADGSGSVLPLREQERRHILRALESTGWVVRGPRGAAALLGLNESTLRSRMKKLGIARGR